jgi:hypothetical protein
MPRLREVDGHWVCDDVSFAGGVKHCDGDGRRWGCKHLDADGQTCHFERNTGLTLHARCLYCSETIQGIPYEADFWVLGRTNFCNEQHYSAEVRKTGNALGRREMMDEEE